MFYGRAWSDWIARYEMGHQDPRNRLCHMFGIPLVMLGLLLLCAALATNSGWTTAATVFGLGWFLQFLGHFFEGRRPEFFNDWRFLLVGARWWITTVFGRT